MAEMLILLIKHLQGHREKLQCVERVSKGECWKSQFNPCWWSGEVYWGEESAGRKRKTQRENQNARWGCFCWWRHGIGNQSRHDGGSGQAWWWYEEEHELNSKSPSRSTSCSRSRSTSRRSRSQSMSFKDWKTKEGNMRNKSQEPASRLLSTPPNQNASRNMSRQAALLANFLRLISDPMARARKERGNFSVIHQGHNLLPL